MNYPSLDFISCPIINPMIIFPKKKLLAEQKKAKEDRACQTQNSNKKAFSFFPSFIRKFLG
jgi:hypothetical protein